MARDTVVMIAVYHLSDPVTGEIRYVGVTVRKLAERLRNHITAARTGRSNNTYRGNWIKSLLSRDLRPEITLVQEVASGHWKEAERYWIAYFREIGCRLTNLAEGGEGSFGYRHTQETKTLMSRQRIGNQHARGNKGRSLPPEQREKIRKTLSGVKHSASRIEANRAGQLGKKLSEDTKARIGEYWKGRSKPPREPRSCVQCHRVFQYGGWLDLHFEKAHARCTL